MYIDIIDIHTHIFDWVPQFLILQIPQDTGIAIILCEVGSLADCPSEVDNVGEFWFGWMTGQSFLQQMQPIDIWRNFAQSTSSHPVCWYLWNVQEDDFNESLCPERLGAFRFAGFAQSTECWTLPTWRYTILEKKCIRRYTELYITYSNLIHLAACVWTCSIFHFEQQFFLCLQKPEG